MHYKEVKAILTPQNGLNIYRGCSCACMYCDARSMCRRMDHAFEDIEVKAHAVDMLEYTLKKKRTRSMIQIGASSEPYLPIEEELKIVRRCLLQIERFDFGVVLHTHALLALRDIDILERIAHRTKCVAVVRVCTCDEQLSRRMEPQTATGKERFSLMRELAEHGITVLADISPILPFINDSQAQMKELLACCRENGVYGVFTDKLCPSLKEGNREWFYQKLYKYFPELYDRYEETFADAKILRSENYEILMKQIRETCEADGMIYDQQELVRFTREYKNQTIGTQMSLFDFI